MFFLKQWTIGDRLVEMVRGKEGNPEEIDFSWGMLDGVMLPGSGG